jgi:hypothetical protein
MWKTEWMTMKGWYAEQGRRHGQTYASLAPDVDPNPVEFIPKANIEERVQAAVEEEAAAVVPVEWLLRQLANCLHNGQETIRIAAGKNGDVYIEMWKNPGGWGNDWPKINLP